jgi:hypothetical protein
VLSSVDGVMEVLALCDRSSGTTAVLVTKDSIMRAVEKKIHVEISVGGLFCVLSVHDLPPS